MSNLKHDLPIRPLYVHRDDIILALCFASVLSLLLYTLIERDCQADTALSDAGFRTAASLLAALDTFCLSLFIMPSGHSILWFDTATSIHRLIWRQLQVPDLSASGPFVLTADSSDTFDPDWRHITRDSPFSRPLLAFSNSHSSAHCSHQEADILCLGVVGTLFVLYLILHAEKGV